MAYEQEYSLINGRPNNSMDSTQDSLGGGWVTASLSNSADVDYFKVSTTSSALIKVELSNALLTTTNHWKVALLYANGDFVTLLDSTVSGTTVVSGSSNTGTELDVSGITSSSVPVGSKFTFATSAADTTVYTVVSATSVQSGASTLTLDKALPSNLAADTPLVFDPAQVLADGGSTSFTAIAPADGSYYVKVSAENWTGADYAVQATVQPTVESTGLNDTKEQAIDPLSNNRLLENAWMTGALSGSTDVDVWVFSTATMPGNITVDFAAPTGNQSKAQWNITVQEWTSEGLKPLLAANAVDISSQYDASASTGTSASFTIDKTRYSTGDTFVVTVQPKSSTVYSTDSYKLKVSGTGLDMNNSPVVTVDTVTSSTPGILVNTGVVRSLKAAAGDGDTTNKVALSTLFSASDADSGQTISTYKIALSAATGSSATGSIKIFDGSTVTDLSGAQLASGITAAQLAKAYFVPGTTTGDLTLSIQAFDSSGALDSSGESSIMSQTLHLISPSVGITRTDDGQLSLVEGNGSNETLTFSLGAAPAADVKIYLGQDSNERFGFSASLLTFTSSNYSTPQSVTVTARNNGISEPSAHSGTIQFRVVSSDSNYDGYTISPLSVSITDPANSVHTGGAAISGTAAQGSLLTATNTLNDADGVGTLNYQWQRSSDGSSWSDIAGGTSGSYTLVQEDVGKKVQVVVSFLDNNGYLETATSTPTDTVANVNDAPAGSVTVSGTLQTGQSLAADTSLLADADGLPGTSTFTYQWKADGVAIDGATGSSYTLTSAVVGKVMSVTVGYTDLYSHQESVTSVATSSVRNAGISLDGLVTFWKDSHKALTGVDYSLYSNPSTDITLVSHGSVNTSGIFQAGSLDEGTYGLTATKKIGDSELAAVKLSITPSDALAALKIAVRLNPNGDGSAVSQYQFLAADFDKNGKVTASDALNILKMAVKLNTTYEWLMVPDTVEQITDMTKDKVTWPSNEISITQDKDIHLVGIVKGDVNGTWSGESFQA